MEETGEIRKTATLEGHLPLPRFDDRSGYNRVFYPARSSAPCYFNLPNKNRISLRALILYMRKKVVLAIKVSPGSAYKTWKKVPEKGNSNFTG